MAQRHLEQMTATQAMIKAFGSHSNPTDAALAMFPTRVVEDSSQDATEVNNFLTKIKNSQASRRLHRSLYTDVSMARSSGLHRPDTTLKFLFRCRKNHLFYEKESQPSENLNNSTNTASNPTNNIPVIHNPNSPASPFLRRAASRDPIHKIKEEIPSPVSQTSSHGSGRSRSKIRSQSMLIGQGLQTIKTSHSVQSSPSQPKNSIEKTSATNPLYFNVHQGTPLKPGFRVKEELTSAVRKTDPPPYPGKPLLARMGMTSTVPMDTFMRELKGALQGISGTFFVNDGRGHLIIAKTCALNESIFIGVQDLLTLGNTYIDLKRMLSRRGQNITKTILLETAEEILNLYITDVGDIPIQNTKFGVQTLSLKALPWLLRLNMLKRSLAIIDQSNALMLEELHSLWISCRGTESEWVMDLLLEAVFGVFCNSMRTWITSGELINDRWIIQGDESGYELVYKPTFASGITLENILKIGVSQSFISEKNLDKLEEFHTAIEAHLVPKNLLTAEGRSMINHLVSEMADWIGRRVMDQLVTKGKLMEYLNAARKYLLLDDAAFAMALHKCIQKISKGAILSGDEAMTAFVTATNQTPSAKQFPFRVVIDSMVSSNGAGSIGSARSEFIQSLHPYLLVQGISEKIFHQTQSKYETLFHFVWAIQTGLYTIEEVADRLREIQRLALWKPEKSGKLPPSGQVHRLFSTVCTRILRLFLAIRQYSLVVISQCTKKFLARLGESSDIDSSTEQHQLFLNELQSSLFCDQDQEKLSALFITLVQKTSFLSKTMTLFENEFSSFEDKDGSESMVEFARAEQSASLSSLRTEILVLEKGLTTIILQLKSNLVEMMTRFPLVSIILNAQ